MIDGQDVHWFWGYTPYTMPINMIGSTAASIPCGFSSDGLPIGLHVIGRRVGRRPCSPPQPLSRRPARGSSTVRRWGEGGRCCRLT